MTATDTPPLVAGPGLYGIPEATYHADTALAPELGRSLSVSGAKTLLELPARYEWQRTHRVDKDEYDVGTVTHELVLRGGDTRLRVIDAYDWRGKADQALKKEHRANGLIPIHRGDLLAASHMARAVRRHRLAGAIFSDGQPERSFYWIDEETGVTCRGRVDWLRDNAIVDFKTTADASPEGFAKSVANYRYDMQAAHYIDGIEVVTGERLPFLFVAVEKAAPHFVAVYQLDDDALARGDRDIRAARRLFAEYESASEWPAYPDDIITLTLPRWAS